MLPEGRRTYRLGDIANIQTGPFGSQLHQRDYKSTGTPILTVENIGNNKVLKEGLRLVGDDDLKRLNKYSLRRGDILFSRVGYVDKRAYISEHEEGWLMSGSCLRIRVTDKSINSRFLSYLLGTESFKQYINGIAFGATRPSLNTSLLSMVELKFPSIEEQSRIAFILSSLDDKIELNLRMNKTLEAIAQAIFKEWFVDFRFPGFDEELVDGLPMDWKKGNLGEEFKLIMGQSPPGESYNNEGEGTVFYQGRTDFGFRFPENRMYTTAPNRMAKKNDTLVSVRAPVGDINMALEECCIGRGLSSVRHLSGAYSYTYYAMKSLENIFNGFEGEGTVFGSISKINFEKIGVLVPTQQIIGEFEKLANPLEEKILSNSLEIKTLTTIRDSLLPKLMTGKIRV